MADGDSASESVNLSGHYEPNGYVASSGREAGAAEPDHRPEYLEPKLRHFQIFFIIISAVIGTSAFNTAGQVLGTAGPVGLLFAVILTGFISWCVAETVGELVQVFRVPNAVFEYISVFLDEDIAWSSSFLYWYCFATILPEEMLSAAALVRYWDLEPPWPPLTFYLLAPVGLVAINLCPVYVYGWIETVAGALKTVLLFAVSGCMFAVSRQESKLGLIAAGSTFDGKHALSPAKAFCYGVPTIVLGFLGIESTIVATFEAKTHSDIVYPALFVHWAIYFMYFFLTVAIVVSAPWQDSNLPPIFGNIIGERDVTATNSTAGDSFSVTILVMENLNGQLAGFVNGCLIFSVLSAGNSAIYYSSRTLWGMTYNLQGRTWISRQFKKLSPLMTSSKAPIRTIVFSFVIFAWIPCLELIPATEKDLQVLSLSSSISCLIVWLMLMVAFLRYKYWTDRCANELEAAGYGVYRRNEPAYKGKARNWLLLLQPGIAIIGGTGILLIFIFSSALWWDTTATAAEFFAVFGPHMVFITLVVVIKVSRKKKKSPEEEKKKWWVWWRPFVQDGKLLIQMIERLEFLAAKREERRADGNAAGSVLGDDIVVDEVDDIADGEDGIADGEDGIVDDEDGIQLQEVGNRGSPTPPVQAHVA